MQRFSEILDMTHSELAIQDIEQDMVFLPSRVSEIQSSQKVETPPKHPKIPENSYDVISAQSSGYLDESRSSFQQSPNKDHPKLRWSRETTARSTLVSTSKLINYVPTMHSKIKLPKSPQKSPSTLRNFEKGLFSILAYQADQTSVRKPLTPRQNLSGPLSPAQLGIFRSPTSLIFRRSDKAHLPVTALLEGQEYKEEDNTRYSFRRSLTVTRLELGRCSLNLSSKRNSLTKLAPHLGDTTPAKQTSPERNMLDTSHASSMKEMSLHSTSRIVGGVVIQSPIKKHNKIEMFEVTRQRIKRPEFLGDACDHEVVNRGAPTVTSSVGNLQSASQTATSETKPPQSFSFNRKSRDSVMQLFKYCGKK